MIDVGPGFWRQLSSRHAKLGPILQEARMKFMNFSRKNAPNVVRLGCVFGDTCFDLTKAIGDDLLESPRVVFTVEEALQIKDGLQLLEDQVVLLERSSSGIQSYLFRDTDVTFRSPITHPSKLIGIGLNYRDHVEEIKGQIPKQPLLFAMYASAIVAPEEGIAIPPMTRQVDSGPNPAVTLGRRGRRLP